VVVADLVEAVVVVVAVLPMLAAVAEVRITEIPNARIVTDSSVQQTRCRRLGTRKKQKTQVQQNKG
jgi:hypothetical protein